MARIIHACQHGVILDPCTSIESFVFTNYVLFFDKDQLCFIKNKVIAACYVRNQTDSAEVCLLWTLVLGIYIFMHAELCCF
jgi:hypothetical protein